MRRSPALALAFALALVSIPLAAAAVPREETWWYQGPLWTRGYLLDGSESSVTVRVHDTTDDVARPTPHLLWFTFYRPDGTFTDAPACEDNPVPIPTGTQRVNVTTAYGILIGGCLTSPPLVNGTLYVRFR